MHPGCVRQGGRADFDNDSHRVPFRVPETDQNVFLYIIDVRYTIVNARFSSFYADFAVYNSCTLSNLQVCLQNIQFALKLLQETLIFSHFYE